MTLAAVGCGGGAGNTPATSTATTDQATTGLSLTALDASGAELSADAAFLRVAASTTDADARIVEVYAYADDILGVELEYDAESWSVAGIERGGYFPAGDLYLESTSAPGTVAIGGWHLDGGEPADSLLATVTLTPGAADRSVSALLPTTVGCTPLNFYLTDVGDGSIALQWQYHCTGDYNQDGLVALTDITPVGIYYNLNSTDTGWGTAALADGTDDGFITVADLTPIGQNYERSITGYKVEQSDSEDGSYTTVDEVAQASGTADPVLEYTCAIAEPVDGGWYRVRSYHSSDESQGSASGAEQVSLLPEGINPVSVPAADVYSGIAPLTVQLSDGGSYDSDGTIVEWLWDLDMDLLFEVDATATSGGYTHEYTTPGTYFARLKVVDNDGRSNTEALTISVSNDDSDPPEASAYCAPNQGWGPLTVNFSPFGSVDPDGSVTAYAWDLDGDGLFETDATADAGYLTHEFTAPGEYTVTLQVTDDTLNTSTASVTVDVWDTAESTVDYWTVFDDSQVRRVDLIVSQANWDLMWVDVNAEVEVEADAVVFGTELDSIGLRMKGNSSLNNPSQKKPWKIDTNEFIDDQEYENLKMLIFNNGFKDPSLAREALAYEMLRAGGVCASNTCFVEIWITIGADPAEFWGVYTMVERVDEKFLQNRYGNKEGNLYKGCFGADFTYSGPNIASYPVYDGEPCYTKKTNEDAADYTDLLNFLDVLNNTADEDFPAAVEEVFNVDSYLRYLASTMLHCNFDVHMYMNQNFYIYSNPETGKFEFIPWDLNQAWGTFGGAEVNQTHPLYDLVTDLERPHASTGENVLFDRVLAVPEYRSALAAYYDLMLRHWFIADEVGQKALAVHDLVGPYVQQGDKMYYGTGSLLTYDAFDRNWEQDVSGAGPMGVTFGVKPFTQTRVDFANAHLLSDL